MKVFIKFRVRYEERGEIVKCIEELDGGYRLRIDGKEYVVLNAPGNHLDKMLVELETGDVYHPSKLIYLDEDHESIIEILRKEGA